MRLLGEAVHRLRHAVEEERLRLLLAAVAVGRGHQLLGLGHGERGEEVGEDGLQRAAQPDVEEVRQVGVADVVVVGRVGGDDLAVADASALLHPPVADAGSCWHRIQLSGSSRFRRLLHRRCQSPSQEWIGLCEIPYHRYRLAAETVLDFLADGVPTHKAVDQSVAIRSTANARYTATASA